jgi:outer membrane protein assembly factor BamB
MKSRVRLFLAAGLAAACCPLFAEDYPQWRGPDRNGIAHEKGLLHQWPEGGPKLLWKNAEIGDGYSTPSIAGGRVYLMSNRDHEEFALALDAKDGSKVWSTTVGKVGKNMGPQYPGARSTPTVDGEQVYVLGSDGDLACLQAADGKIVWKRNLKTDFGGKPGMWAYSESPLTDGDVVVCTPGGPTATMVALNKKTGEDIWKCAVPGGDMAAYASAVIGQVGKVKMYIQFLHKGLVGVDARSGKFLWRYAKTSDQAANIPTPVFHDGYVFSSTGRNQGALIKLVPTDDGISVEEVWTSKPLQISIGGVVLVDGYLYGTNGKELLCVEFLTGTVKWQNPCVGTASLCAADGDLYVRGDGGSFQVKPSIVALVEATPAGYKEKGRFEQPDRSTKRPAWPYPVVSEGQLYLRDMGVLLCYDVKGAAGTK